jgi:hypothetical protein
VGKNYEVEITAYATVLVIDADDEDHAREIAEDELFGSDYEIGEIRTEEVSADKLDSHRRHATKVVEADA